MKVSMLLPLNQVVVAYSIEPQWFFGFQKFFIWILTLECFLNLSAAKDVDLYIPVGHSVSKKVMINCRNPGLGKASKDS